MTEDSRYPYTYAADFIRSIAGYGENGTKLSRADASKIRTEIANVLGLEDELVAIKLADFYKKNEEEISAKSADDFLRSQGYKD